MEEKSYFIVFEGLDGCGKTTQMMMAGKHLFELKRFDPVLLTREPTLRNQGKKIRGFLKTDTDPISRARQFVRLYFEDRKEHLKKDILPILKNNGSIVLCDRYNHSSYAIQQAQGMQFSEIKKIHSRLPKPDLTLIFDIPAETAYSRMKMDFKRKSLHKFEQKEFMKKIRSNYLNLKKQLPEENIIVVDADRPREEVFRVVQKEIMKLIDKEKA